ncbi:MAG: ATP-binding cassette domain-containing protein [Actinobacteria bacterium]|nr:ATP-binding cassette domain-containing protein [Actinomycetota bacterium]
MESITVLQIICSFGPLVNFLLVNVVSEKERGIKESFYVMGMNPSAYWLSWLVTYFVIGATTSLLLVFFLWVLGIFVHSSFLCLYIQLASFTLSVVTMGLLLSLFFSQSKIAGIVGAMSTNLFSLAVFGLQGTVPTAVKWASSLVPPIAMQYGLLTSIRAEIYNTDGLQFKDLTEGDFSILDGIFMLCFDSCLFFFLAYVLEKFVPGNGPTKSWGSIFGRICMSRKSSGCVEMEPLDFDGKNVQVRHLTKIFTTDKKKAKVALKDVSLTMSAGQIFALLGHNGAGKSTLHSILSGLMDPSDGFVNIFGHITTSTPCYNIGVCPQKDILLDQLTVTEHLCLIGVIKGIMPDDVAYVAQRSIERVSMTLKADDYSSVLSGGQKRKLSVAMALIGSPRLVCLDEPTSGMDPYSRRQLWAVLQEEKKDRVILLTTHQMDEADILADQKAVLSAGTVQCVGTSLTLKTKYGVGYHLNFVRTSSFSFEKMLAALTRFVTSVKFEEKRGDEVIYLLPSTSSSSFPELFQYLDHSFEDLGIVDYGISMTTLEEVFLKLQELSDVTVKAQASAVTVKNRNVLDDHRESDDATLFEEAADKTPLLGGGESSINIPETVIPDPLTLSWWAQVLLLAGLRFKLSKRNPRAIFAQFVVRFFININIIIIIIIIIIDIGLLLFLFLLLGIGIGFYIIIVIFLRYISINRRC